MIKNYRHVLRGFLLAALALILLGGFTGCAFQRVVVNEDIRTVDLAFIKIGETKWMDVMKTIGPPVPLGTLDDSRRNISARHLRYGSFDSRTYRIMTPYLIMPFTWGDERNVEEILIEFDEKGYVSQVTRTSRDTIWMPFQGEGSRKPNETVILSKEGMNAY